MKRAINAVRYACLTLALGGCATTTGQPAQSFSSPEEARLVGLARDIESRGEPATALALYERAAELAQDSPAAQVRLGEARLKVRDNEGASAAFQAALTRNPSSPDALLGLGTAELNQGELDRAIQHLSVAAPQVKTAIAYNRLGTALVLHGKPAEAKSAYSTAQQLDPQNIDLAGNVALAEALAGESEAAVAHMRAVAQSPLAKPRHQRNLVVVLALAGRDGEAAEMTMSDMSARQKADLVARARKLSKIEDPVARARAVGLMAGA